MLRAMFLTFQRGSPALALALGVGFLNAGCAGTPTTALREPTVVEASCGECKFGLPGTGCDLAVRIDGHGYYVDGVAMDSLGDAHAADGMCETIRWARVTGEVRKGRFMASSFELLPEPAR